MSPPLFIPYEACFFTLASIFCLYLGRRVALMSALFIPYEARFFTLASI